MRSGVWKKTAVLLLALALIGISPPRARSASPTPTPTPTPSPTPAPTTDPALLDLKEEKLRELEQKREERQRLEEKLAGLQEQGLSLANQISYKETEIALTAARIEETTAHIAALQAEIKELGAKIARLEDLLDSLTEVTKSRIAATYKTEAGGVNPIFLVFRTENVSEFVNRYKYFQVLQEHDKRLLKQMEASRANYDEQRRLKADKQAQAQALEAQLKSQKEQLAVQKQEKEKLLAQVQEEERHTREKIEALRADEQAIKKALEDIFAAITSGLVTGQKVSKGDVIGRQGNTGYVFPRPSAACPECGSHLHFMILTCADPSRCYTDPTSYLDNDNYAKPLTSWRVTQNYGRASCSMYRSCFHSGIDLVDNTDLFGQRTGPDGHTTGHGAPIYAIADGELFYGVDGMGGKYAIIKHADDFYSAYWHLQ
jgi:peptidoglycan hydrolase CwlO-like protein